MMSTESGSKHLETSIVINRVTLCLSADNKTFVFVFCASVFPFHFLAYLFLLYFDNYLSTMNWKVFLNGLTLHNSLRSTEADLTQILLDHKGQNISGHQERKNQPNDYTIFLLSLKYRAKQHSEYLLGKDEILSVAQMI